jgi:hypothetical protein
MTVVHPNFCSDIYCEQDMLGFDKYVNTLAGMIRDKDFATPSCIGIYGKWVLERRASRIFSKTSLVKTEIRLVSSW